MPKPDKGGGVLFFYPPYSHLDDGCGGFAKATKMPRVPLGAASVFEYISQNVDVASFFYYSEDHSVAAIRSVIRDHKPAIVALSCFSYNRIACLSIARIAKIIDPSVKVILGGIHPTFLDEQMLLHYSFVDYIVRGEGEVTFHDLVQTLLQGKDPEFVAGISFRRENGVVRTKPRIRAESLDSFPPVNFSTFTAQRRKKKFDNNSVNSFPVETSRGCPFSCSFCNTVGLWGRRVTSRSVDRVIEQIRLVPEQAGSTLLFHDMNFTLNKEYLEVLYAALRRQRINIPWYCVTRIDLVDEQLLRMMKKAGCAGIFFGVESLSRKILKSIDKKYTPELAIRNINLAANMGLYAQFGFIIGFPGETEETLQELVSNCKKLHSRIRGTVSPLLLIPGSAIYAQALKEGFDESYWLHDHHETIPFYEGALPLSVLTKWMRVFNSFLKPPLA
jgi:radical SAM superfamily enzyme YgiQ (UPF0313 family)